MKITKTVTQTFEVHIIKYNFATYNAEWRRIRENHKYKGFNCFSCGKLFVEGEAIAVAFCNKGNKVICELCGYEIEKEGYE